MGDYVTSKKSKKQDKTIKTAVIAAIVIAAVLFIGYQWFFTGSDDVAATVNGVVIMKDDVIIEYLKVPPEYRNIMTADQILEGMIIRELLYQEADMLGIEVTDNDVEVYLEESLTSIGKTEGELIEELASTGATLDELKASLKNELLIASLFNETVLADLEVTEREAKNYYDQNTAQFITPEQIKASHILLETEKEAVSVRNKALGGAKFDELAAEYSTGPSGPNGGDLGFFGKGMMVPEFEEAAFALEDIGDISEVVETQFGFHVIKLTDRKEEEGQQFEEVKEDIIAGLLSQKQIDTINIYTAQLEAAADIEVFQDMYKEPEGKPLGEIIAESREQNAEEQPAGETETAPADTQPAGADSVAECMTSKGVKMYGSSASSISNEQTDMFGADFAGIDYVDCSANKEECKEEKIISYPTWIINEKKYPGKYSIERLAEISEC